MVPMKDKTTEPHGWTRMKNLYPCLSLVYFFLFFYLLQSDPAATRFVCAYRTGQWLAWLIDPDKLIGAEKPIVKSDTLALQFSIHFSGTIPASSVKL